MGKEQRIFTRVEFQRPVRLHESDGDASACALREVSRGGLSVSLGRYLRPGPAVEFEFDDITYRGQAVRFIAIVKWCRPDHQHPERFRAGFQVVHGERDTLGAVSEVFYHALARAAGPRTEAACAQ